ncbi:hypothetical protein [Paraflavitalea pollutisoli]|uniref:hypothetical protein n=1 Tax=Paraflavitalea pollutisoli TaxID=3034143 RepID=UPI0023EB242E|nr:hypothetical protein [Paraflavitalea sp. H1-2-19X]
MRIGRTLFWFSDGDEQLVSVNDDFFGIGTLLNRLLNEKYDGRKITFINLHFYPDKTFALHPIIPKDAPYYYGGHLSYYGWYNLKLFNLMNWNEKKLFVWEKGFAYLKQSAEFTKNEKLLEAAQYAYSKGLEMNLNPDYRLLDLDFDVSGQKFRASLWINFEDDGMSSLLSVEKDTTVIFEKPIDKSRKGIEYFLVMYKSLLFDEDRIIIKGDRDVEYLPLRVPLSEFCNT